MDCPIPPGPETLGFPVTPSTVLSSGPTVPYSLPHGDGLPQQAVAPGPDLKSSLGALAWRDEHEEPSPPPPVKDAHGPLPLSPKPGYLHLWVGGGLARGHAVQQRHPEAELVPRP